MSASERLAALAAEVAALEAEVTALQPCEFRVWVAAIGPWLVAAFSEQKAARAWADQHNAKLSDHRRRRPFERDSDPAVKAWVNLDDYFTVHGFRVDERLVEIEEKPTP